MTIKRNIRPRRPAVSAGPARLAQIDQAMEKHGLRYIPLTCGHYGDRNEDEIYRAIRPTRNHHWCTTCSKWNLTRRTPRRIQPNEPLF